MTFHDASLRSVDADPALAVSWAGQPAMGTHWRLLDLDDDDLRVHIGPGFDASYRAAGAEMRRVLHGQEEIVVSVSSGPPDLVEAASRDPARRSRVPLGEVLGYLGEDASYELWGGEL